MVQIGNACDFLVLGTLGAGKTLLIKRLQGALRNKQDYSADVVQTNGTEIHDLWYSKKNGKKLVIREVGASMVSLWPRYFSDCSTSVIFVIDVSQHASIAPAALELYSLIKNRHLAGRSFLVVLNKQDLPCTLTRVELDMILCLPELEQEMKSRLHIMETSALTGAGTQEVLEWMVQKKEASSHRARAAPSHTSTSWPSKLRASFMGTNRINPELEAAVREASVHEPVFSLEGP